jgi:hypothetical protein
MQHPIHRVESFQRLGPYTLQIVFSDGLCREIDCSPILEGELLSPLRDPALFAQVTFDPAILHDWPAHEADFKAAARRWSQVTV